MSSNNCQKQLHHLPDELLSLVCSHLTPQTFLNLRLVNKDLYSFIQRERKHYWTCPANKIEFEVTDRNKNIYDDILVVLYNIVDNSFVFNKISLEGNFKFIDQKLVIHGKSILITKHEDNDIVINGIFHENKLEGIVKTKMYSHSKLTDHSIINFKNGLIHGPLRDYYDENMNHRRWEGYFIEGKKQGSFRKWYITGQLASEYNYLDDMEEGLQVDCDIEGRKFTYHAKKGIRDGLEQIFDTKGKLTEEAHWVNGYKNGCRTYYKDGKPIYRI